MRSPLDFVDGDEESCKVSWWAAITYLILPWRPYEEDSPDTAVEAQAKRAHGVRKSHAAHARTC